MTVPPGGLCKGGGGGGGTVTGAAGRRDKHGLGHACDLHCNSVCPPPPAQTTVERPKVAETRAPDGVGTLLFGKKGAGVQ